MAGGRDESKRVRLFVALDLPGDLRAGIAEWGRGSLTDPALRPIPQQSLHITLAFLGSREPEQVEPIAELVRASAVPAPRIALGQVEQRPRRGRAKVYALAVDSTSAKELQAGLVAKLNAAGLYEAEERPYWPHVTVARVRTEPGRKRVPMRVERAPKPVPQGLLQACFCRRMTFYRSELQPGGAHYVPLAQVELPG